MIRPPPRSPLFPYPPLFRSGEPQARRPCDTVRGFRRLWLELEDRRKRQCLPRAPKPVHAPSPDVLGCTGDIVRVGDRGLLWISKLRQERLPNRRGVDPAVGEADKPGVGGRLEINEASRDALILPTRDIVARKQYGLARGRLLDSDGGYSLSPVSDAAPDVPHHRGGEGGDHGVSHPGPKRPPPRRR